jgi:alcohol dehydrogenase (cytochrome c)
MAASQGIMPLSRVIQDWSILFRRVILMGRQKQSWSHVILLAVVVAEPVTLFSAPQVEKGQRLFSEYCAVCHGAFGEGGSGPDLTNVLWQSGISDSELEHIIYDGVRGTAMPGFGDRLDQDARRSLVLHLRQFAAKAIQPANERKAPRVMVGAERLLAAHRETDSWLMYGRDYSCLRFSPLDQINQDNVRNLVPLWSFQTGVPDGLQATPLFVDGVLYLSTAWNHAFAIDARTGAELWHYKRRLPEKLVFCCGPVNRGLAILDETLYMGTLDAHLVALDAQTGRVRWDVSLGRVEDNLSATAPPLIVGNKVVVGMAGGDYASRGFIDAYYARSGQRAWRFYTIPGEAEKGATTWSGDSYKGGGGGTWMNGSYDPVLNLVYWGVGNPYPVHDGDAREGDNLYTDCVVALEADTGKLRWHYQFTPHDVWDYDGVNEMVLIDLEVQGRLAKALVHADRNGYFYALDRSNGNLIYAKPFVRVTWSSGFDSSGRPVVNPSAVPTVEGVTVCPGAAGGKEWNAMTYSPMTQMIYLPAIENCAVFTNNGVKARQLNLPAGESGFRYLPNQAYGKVMAIHVTTGERAWEVKTRTPMAGGMLATAGGLVFTGDPEGNFMAYAAETGSLLWSFQTGSGIRASPISYRMDGRQYLAVLSGLGGAVGGFTGAGAPWMRNYRTGDSLYVFGLFEPGGSMPYHGGAR